MSGQKKDEGGHAGGLSEASRLLSSILEQRRLLGRVEGGGSPLPLVLAGKGILVHEVAWSISPLLCFLFGAFTGS